MSNLREACLDEQHSLSRKRYASAMTLSEEGVPEHGKLWCLVHHMWKVLKPCHDR